ncbi:7539_t:CDS:1 [Ambispora gerdemannii]|uniref:phenylalanine--tRNA ligase n=1 Tax=Ambispora gerdemannii TaxID=144530 RepID=A0A9N9CL58_9GLOM|nr:7539_t:CDS:1 [Ambispora gerdemannii]
MANLVMLESGQPLHIFDYDTLPAKKKIIVRQARQLEIINPLAGPTLALNSADIVVGLGGEIIDLAGIIGSRSTAITPTTKNILIECASFSAEAIKKTVKSLNISSTASRYFQRGTNVVLPLPLVLQRVIFLILETYGGNPKTGLMAPYKEARPRKIPLLTITPNFIKKKLGQIITEEVMLSIYRQLNFACQKKGNIYYISPPTQRRDITSSEDLLEELLRVYDYNKIVSSLPANFSKISFKAEEKTGQKKQQVRTYLANCGWQEIITYSLISREMKEEFTTTSDSYRLLLPKNDYHQYYRQTLIPSHLKTLKYNLSRGNKNLFFFEISSVYSQEKQEELLILSGVGGIINQSLHQLTSEVDFY